MKDIMLTIYKERVLLSHRRFVQIVSVKVSHSMEIMTFSISCAVTDCGRKVDL